MIYPSTYPATSQSNRLELDEMYRDVLTAENSGRHRLNSRRAVLRLVPHGGIGAEIGVFTGMFAPILDNVCKPRKMYLVDPWEKLHGTHFPNWNEYTNHVRVPTAGAKQAVELRTTYMNCETEVITAFSKDWLSTKEKGAVDWVYLDANHRYAEVLSDLHAIDAVLSENGMILGDDGWVKRSGEVNGVYKAIHVFCREKDYVLIHLDEHGQWAIKRAGDVIKPSAVDTEIMTNSTSIADPVST